MTKLAKALCIAKIDLEGQHFWEEAIYEVQLTEIDDFDVVVLGRDIILKTDEPQFTNHFQLLEKEEFRITYHIGPNKVVTNMIYFGIQDAMNTIEYLLGSEDWITVEPEMACCLTKPNSVYTTIRTVEITHFNVEPASTLFIQKEEECK